MIQIPFYERTVDSFSDEAMTRVSQASHGGWYACLDWGPHDGPGQPDFATCAGSEQEARRYCAAKVRKSITEGKRSCFYDYDLHFKLMKHWVSKEMTVDTSPETAGAPLQDKAALLR